jgi:hypothetical protein
MTRLRAPRNTANVVFVKAQEKVRRWLGGDGEQAGKEFGDSQRGD